LAHAIEKNNQCDELALSNQRLRNLLTFRKVVTEPVLAAEVIGKDPSPWFKTIIIDKGRSEGVEKGLPVLVPEGIAGQVTEVSNHYSKVLLIIDRNSAVDAMVQRTRARGVIKGEPSGQCLFKYVLRKRNVAIGDVVVSSGLDGVFPKGLRVGYVSGFIKRSAGIFQDVTVTPYVDFEKIEEVFVVLSSSGNEFMSRR
jgi:rod shape-determining protein MreC